MKFCLNMKSATPKVRQTVPNGVSNCPLAIISWNFVTEPVSPETAFGANNVILSGSCSEIAHVRSPISIMPSSVRLRNPLQNITYDVHFFRVRFADKRRLMCLFPQ